MVSPLLESLFRQLMQFLSHIPQDFLSAIRKEVDLIREIYVRYHEFVLYLCAFDRYNKKGWAVGPTNVNEYDE